MNGGRKRLAQALSLAALVGALNGCDVAVAGLLASRSSKSSSSGGAAPPPDTSYKVYVRALGGTAGELDNEKAALDAAGGNPGAGWTFVASGIASQEFDVSALAGGPFSAILIQAPEAQDYHIDAIELFDANGTVIETALSSAIRSDELAPASLEADVEGFPDGRTADTDSTPTASAYLFARLTNPVERFRVSLWGITRGSGDVEWVRTFASAGNQKAGGSAVKTDGTFYVAYGDESPRHMWLITYLADGNSPGVPAGSPPAPLSLETNVTTSVGSQSVAVNGSNVYVATTWGAGEVRVSKIEGPGGNWSQPFGGAGVDRVEANGIAVDSDGNVLIACGYDFGGVNGLGHYLQKYSAAGTQLWPGAPSAPADLNPTYWHSVAAAGATNIYTSGDLTGGLPSSIQVATRLSDATSNGAEVRTVLDPGSDGTADLGRSVGVDGAGNVYVAGYRGVSGPGRNSFIGKYAADLLSSLPILDSTASGDDEVLDIAVESDGTVFAVGYETVTSPAQGRNLFIQKYAPNGALVWRRTLDGGFGDDIGVSVSTTSTHVYVSGEVTASGGTRDVHVRRYVK